MGRLTFQYLPYYPLTMKTNSEEPPCDLGDISSLKIGDEVVIVRWHNGLASIRPTIYTIKSERNGNFIVTSERSEGRFAGGFNRDTAYGIQTIYSSPYWFSANPEHIATAKRQIEEQRRKEQELKTERERLMDIAMPIVDHFAFYDIDSAEGIAETLCDSLSEEQITILKGWLKL